MFDKIVVGLDGSETSDRALHAACDLAVKYGAELHLVHAPQPHMAGFAVGAIAGYHAAATMPDAETVTKEAEKVLEDGKTVVSAEGLPPAKTYLTRGDAADEIIKCAEACGANLIVTGRRGLGAVGALVQGSTTQRVNHKAHCACLSVA